MWYRNYIMSMPKELYHQIKDMEREELSNLYWDDYDRETWYFSIHSLGDKVQDVYELWKYFEHDVSEFCSPLFSKFNIHDDWECELFCKEGFANIINYYSDKIAWLYQALKEKNSIDEYRKYVDDYLFEWSRKYKPFNLERWDEVTTSRKYEYAIFEMVRLYKTFDYEKNILIYYGW